MPYYLLLCRSITHAQRISGILERAGISAHFFRPPMGLSDRGCGYAVRVGTHHLRSAMELLRSNGVNPAAVFYSTGDGAFSEVRFS